MNKSLYSYYLLLMTKGAINRLAKPPEIRTIIAFSIGGRNQLHLIEGAPLEIVQEKQRHICFSVAPLEDFMASLDALNIPYGNFAGEPKAQNLRSDGIRQIFFQDPDGY